MRHFGFVNICRKFNGPSSQNSNSSTVTPLRIDSFRAFYTVGINSFGPDFVKNFYNNEKRKTYKVWVTLYTCASSGAILLDLVPSKDSQTFIKSFKRFRQCSHYTV